MTARPRGKKRRSPEDRHGEALPADRPPGSSPLPRWILAGAVFSLLLVALSLPVLTRRAEPRWDARDLNYPAFTYLADSLGEGRLPLWDPYTNCGYPFHADPILPTLNPVALLLGYAVTDTAAGFIAFWLFHWWLGGIGMLWLARMEGAGPAGGLAAAAAYAFSGFFVGSAEITPLIVSAAWLPWILGMADRAVSGKHWGWALLGGATYGISMLGGYPGLGTFSGLAVALWLLLRYVVFPAVRDGEAASSRRRQALRVAGTLALLGAVSLAVWSPVITSFFTEGRGYTERVSPIPPGTPDFGGDVFSLPAHLSAIFPYATVAGRPWMGADIAMTNGYAGAFALPLAALWFLRGGGKGRPWWLLSFFLFAYAVSLGPVAGLRTLLYYIFPPIRYVRYSSIFRLYWILPLALAAGLGLSRILDRPDDRRLGAWLMSGWTVAGAAVSVALLLFLRSHDGGAETIVPRLFLPAALTLPAGTAVLWGWSRAARVFPLFFIVLFLGDLAAHVRNNDFTLWVEQSSMRQAEMFHRRSTWVPGEPGRRHPPLPFGYFNAQQVIKEPVVQGFVAMKSKGFDEVLCRSRFVEVMQSGIRFWLSPGTETAHSREEALSVLSAAGLGNPIPAFLEGIPPPLPPGRAVPGSYGKVRVLSYAPERVELEVESPDPNGGFLLSTERYAAGWSARMDGLPAEVLPVNLFFRGLSVPPGKHAVTWRYEPRLWKPLLALSAVALLAATGAGLFLILRRKVPPSRPSS